MDTDVQIFVREAATRRFVAEDGSWVAALRDSRKFRNTWDATEFCLKRKLKGVQIVMRMGEDERYDVIIDCPHDARLRWEQRRRGV